MTEQSERSLSTLTEMAKRGTDYREDYEFELYGEPVKVVLRPLSDNEYLPLAALLAEHLDLDDDIEDAKVAEKASEHVEEEAESEEQIDISQLDEKFVEIMQEAAVMGLCGQHTPDGDEEKLSDEQAREVVDQLMGGYSVELGNRVLEIAGDVRDADKFRGSRGRIGTSGDS